MQEAGMVGIDFAFPEPMKLASLDVEYIKDKYRVGFRLTE